MNEVCISYYHSPVGELVVGSLADELCLLDWRYRKMREVIDRRIKAGLSAEYREGKPGIHKEVEAQLDAYFEGKRKKFEIPLKLVGTEFQERVWKELMEIPFGEAVSYLALGRKLGDERAIRAVAGANGANAIAIIIPCHRVIGSKGELVGYAGGLPAKKKLLALEGYRVGGEQRLLF